MRAFLAIELPPPIGNELSRQQALLRAAICTRPAQDGGVRWGRPEGIHLTLKFLGEISAEQSNQVTQRLRRFQPFEKLEVEVKGFGFFPDARRPRVFWAGIAASPGLAELASKIEAAMAEIGFEPEKRPFAPHLTLARFKTPLPQPALQAMLRRQGEQSLGCFEVSEFFLFESKLCAGAPAQYLKLARFPEQ